MNSSDHSTNPRLISLRAAAMRTGLEGDEIIRLCEDAGFQVYKFPTPSGRGRIRISGDDIEALIESARRPTAAQAVARGKAIAQIAAERVLGRQARGGR